MLLWSVSGVVIAGDAAAPVQVEWVARFDSPGDAATRDFAGDLAVDVDGNAYLTAGSYPGSGSRDGLLLKYGPDGREVWTLKLGQYAQLVRVGPSGCAYVVGILSRDLLVAKVAPDSEVLWSSTFSSSEHGSGLDEARDVALDASGNVWVTGLAVVSNQPSSFLTVKFDTMGRREWAVQLLGDGQTRRDMRAYAIVVDASGHAYVAGGARVDDPAESLPYALLKYDEAGNQLWVRWLEGPTSNVFTTIALELDGEGGVYVARGNNIVARFDATGNEIWTTHVSENSSRLLLCVDRKKNPHVAYKGVRDFVATKLDSDGNEVWTSRYLDPARELRWITEIAMDAQDNLYIYGQSLLAVRDVTLVRIDVSGSIQWASHLETGNPENGSASASVAVTDECVWIAATTFTETESYLTTVKYDASGNDLWVARKDSAGYSVDTASDLILDGAGCVYVTGTSTNTTSPGFRTAKYDSTGELLWVREFPGAAQQIDLGRAGDVYVTGTSYEGKAEPSAIVTLRYAPDGTLRWSSVASSPRGIWIYDPMLAVGAQGHVYVAGTESEGRRVTRESSFFLARKGETGEVIWTTTYGLGDSYNQVKAISVDGQGHLVVAGDSSPFTDLRSDFVILKYDDSGRALWERRFEQNMATFDYVADLAIDDADSIYVTGESSDYGSIRGFATVKYSPEGKLQWSAVFDGGRRYGRPRAMTLIDDGGLVVAGQWNAQDTGDNFVTLKYDSTGSLLWSREYDGPASGNDQAVDVAIGSSGEILVTGVSRGESTGDDYVTLSYDPVGREIWSIRFDGPTSEQDIPVGIAVDGEGSVFVSGTSAGLFQDFATVKYRIGANEFRRGDVDGSGVVNVTDAVLALLYLNAGGPAPSCLKAMDVDDDAVVLVTDPIFVLTYLFRGGPSPPQPFSECGSDTTPDSLSCNSFAGCPDNE